MAKITIPNPLTKTIVQTNNSDVLGSIYISQNIDLVSNVGRFRAGKRMVVNSADTDSGLSTLTYPVAFVSFDDKIWTLGGNTSNSGKVYANGSTQLQANFVADSNTSTPTDISSQYSDMINGGNGYIYATSGDAIYQLVTGGGTWTNQSLSLGVHMMATYGGRIYVSTLGDRIYSADISTGAMGTLATSGSYTLRLGLDSFANNITFIRASASRLWIGVVNTRGGKGYVYEWDGQSTAVTRSYRLESTGALACVIKDEIPYIVDTNGDLLYWSGGAFVKLAGFNKKGKNIRLKNPNRQVNDRFIHPNGMSIIDGRINILINNENYDYTATVNDTVPSGVLEYTQENGLVHKGSLGLTKSSDTIIDYGQTRIKHVGALSELVPNNNDSNRNGTYLAGASIFTDATTTKAIIAYEDTKDTLQKSAIIVTPFIESSEATDSFNRFYLKHKKLINASDKVVIKSRTNDDGYVEATITWTSTTTFTVPNSSVVVSNYWTSDTGGEVEVIQGLGSCKCSHITNAVLAGGTWTVTVDETYTGATGTSIARFSNWNKVGVTDNQVQQFHDFSIPDVDDNNTCIQFKLWILFTGANELQSMTVISKTHENLV